MVLGGEKARKFFGYKTGNTVAISKGRDETVGAMVEVAERSIRGVPA